MKKKMLACLLAISMMCTSGGIAWAAADEEVEVFSSDVSAENETEAVDEEQETTEVFGEPAEPQETEQSAIFGDGTEEETDLEMFSDAEQPDIFSSGNTDEENVLTVDHPVTIVGDAQGNASFELNIGETGGIYKLNYTNYLWMEFSDHKSPGIGNGFRVREFAPGVYTVQCSELSGETTIIAEKLPDIHSMELLSCSPDTFYMNEPIEFDSAEVKIVKADGSEEKADLENGSPSYGNLSYGWSDNGNKAYITLQGCPSVQTSDITIKRVPIMEDSFTKLTLNSEKTQITPSSVGCYYFEFQTNAAGAYKLIYDSDKNLHSVIYKKEVLNDGQLSWEWMKDAYTYGEGQSIVELAADTRYLVRVSGSDITGNLPAAVQSVRSIQTFQLAPGQKMPSEAIEDVTEISDEMEFCILYTDNSSETITFAGKSADYGRISRIYEADGSNSYALSKDPLREQEGHFVRGPRTVDFDDSTSISEVLMEKKNEVPVSETYLDGAYFKFTASVAGNYEFDIENTKDVTTEKNLERSSYGSDGNDFSIKEQLAKGATIYFAAKELTADNVEVTVTKKPMIKSIQLKKGSLEGATFIRGIVEEFGWSEILEGCTFEIQYEDGTSPETLSYSNGYGMEESAYYGDLWIKGLWEEDGNISAGDKKISFFFNGAEVTTPEYNIHVAERPASSQTTLLSPDSEQSIKKGSHGARWASFQAPETGTYYFVPKADGQDLTGSCACYWAKAGSADMSQKLSWGKKWNLETVELQKNQIIYIGLICQGKNVTAKMTGVPAITRITLAEGETLEENYIEEFLEYGGNIEPEFKIEFSDGTFDTYRTGDTITKNGKDYGKLTDEWPRTDGGEYITGILKIYVGDSYQEGRDYAQQVTIKSAAEADDLPKLVADPKMDLSSPFNYNNSHCLVFEAAAAGTYEFTFTPTSAEQEDGEWYHTMLLRNDMISDESTDRVTTFIRTLSKGEKLFFLCDLENGFAEVKAAEAEGIEALSVTPTYSDLLYGAFDGFEGWKFQLELNDGSKSEISSVYSRFDKYGRIEYKLDDEHNSGNSADIGGHSVQFYLGEFPDITSDEIQIQVKKGSDMNFKKLLLDTKTEWKDTGVYAAMYCATFTPQENAIYQYYVDGVGGRMVDDDGNRSYFWSDEEGTFKGEPGIGYTFLSDYGYSDEAPEGSIIITKIDKSKLRSLFDANKNKSSSGYTSSSWNAFTDALEAAEQVLENKYALQSEIDKALSDLQSAINGLTYIYYPPSIDKSALRKLYDTCSAYKEADYTASSWKAFQEALKSAKNVLDTSTAQSSIDQAEKELKAAAEALVKIADKNDLKAACEKYKAYKKDDYTSATWNVFEKALAAACTGIENADLKDEEAAKLLTTLEKAAAGLLKVGIPVIKKVTVNGNTAAVTLSGTAEKAAGYDFVIGAKDCVDKKNYTDVRKNILKTQAEFKYIQAGGYYVYCHAWKKADGKKVFGPWSEPCKFTISATTPSTPKIKSVSVKGNTVTVTLEKIKGVTSYDAILGKQLGNDSSYGKRPVNYGKMVVKAKSNKIVFKNVKKGTYYFGVHAANRTANDGKKVFSKWTVKKITVK